MDEMALQMVLDGLIDSWHRKFAINTITLYLKHANKHSYHIPDAGNMVLAPNSCPRGFHEPTGAVLRLPLTS